MTSPFRSTTSIVLLLLCTTVLTTAQSYRGSIRGKVVDPSGGVIAGAKITAKSSATGLTRDTMTDADGAYVLAELPAGQYVVVAESAGLSPVAQNVVVNVGLDTTADFDLTKVERKMEEVTVSGALAPVVEESRDVLGEIVDHRLVNELPLNGRDFGKLVALVPGVTVEPAGVAGTQFGFGQFNINGNRDRSNNYLLDGTDNNDPYFNNSALNQVGITGAPATLLPIDAIQEFNLQSQFSAEYGRNSGSVVNIITRSGSNQFHGSAFEFLRNSALDARNYFNTDPRKTSFQNNQFGGSLGGPILRDKTFFFAAYEGQRERVGSDFLLGVPTAGEITAAQQVALAQIDPNTGNPFISSINPALLNILSFYPSSGTGQIASVVRDKNDLDNFIAKIDHNLSNNEQLSGRYAFGRSEQTFPLGNNGGFGKGSRLPAFAQTSPTRVQVVSVSLLSTLSPSKINEVRFGYSRYRTSFSSLDANFDPSTLGPNFDLGTGKLGLPEFDFSIPELENLGAQGFSVPRGRTSQTFQILDNFTFLHGRHTIKLGGEFRRAAIDNFNDNVERGIFQYSPDGLDPNPVVDVLANFFLGGVQDPFSFFVLANTGNTHRTNYNNGLAFFAQDDFRARPNFTLNLGLRWEYFGPLSEKNNLLSNLAPDGTLALVGTHGLDGVYRRDLNNFGPRIGFAWSVTPSTVLRGGYGIYYDYVPMDLFIANFTSSAGVATNPIGPEPVFPLGYDPTAFNGSNPGAPVLTPITTGPFTIFATPRDFPSPYIQNFNLNVQQKLGESASLEVGYVGSKGTRLVRLRDANQPDENFNYPNPNFASIDELTPISSSTYSSLQTTLRLQTLHGFSGFASYIWGKSLDDASDGIDFTAGAAFPQDSNNLRAEHGASTFDTRHRFTAALNYDVPRWQRAGGFGSGWQLNWIVSAQSGRPIPIITSDDTTGRFYFNQRPNVVPGVNPILPHWNPVTGYLNPNAFSQPAFGTFGDLGRDSIYGPNYWNLDFSVTKNTRLREKLNLQLRAEFFNIFNHPNFALPNGSITPGLGPAGQISQTPDVAQGNPGLGGGGPRVIQIGAKLNF
ncbi:MAG TPA: carboxypeptidase regulatory-like domain-containing protein [Terriglobales bacterium]|nr:carboxypeptidase regulatory-like domain-containing protein [Terriglobales bacterium]